MPRKREDLTGKASGKLTVIEFSHMNLSRTSVWRCRCSCGNEALVQSVRLKRKETRSCGCLRADLNTTHGMTSSPEFKVWMNMRKRCNNPNSRDYERYGGRGITVCDEWGSFSRFFEDMGPRPDSSYSIDRIDNNGGYSKSNCRWADQKTQCRNTRRTRMIKHNGEERCMVEWAELAGIPYSAFCYRVKAGWSDARLFQPTRKQAKVSQ